MGKFKLSSLKKLFPDKDKDIIKKDKEIEYGKMFNISQEEKKRVVNTVIDMVEEMKRQREGLMEIKAEAVRNYEGDVSANGPWEGSSNISTMITTIAADMIHSKLFPMVWNLDLLHFVGTEKHDELIAKNNEVLIKWALTKDMEDTQQKVDDCIHRIVVDGTVIIKRVWETYYTYVTRVVADSVNSKGDMQYKVEYDMVRRERCRWILKDLDHVYFTFNAENEQRADIIDEIYVNMPMLREMKEKGLILGDVDMDKVKSAVEKTFDPEGTIKARYNTLGLEAYYARLDSYPIKLYEAWIKYAFVNENIRKECVFLVLPDQQLYMAGKPLHVVSRIGKKPWTIRSFLRRPGTMHGKGIPELVRHLHKEMNAIHNQRIDAGNMVIAPFFFFRAASGMDPEEISVKPATGIPLDDPQRDVYFPDYNPSRLSVSFQEESILMDLIEKLTYLTPAALGRETASRPTARGTLAVIAEGERKFGLLGTRVQRVFTDLITGTRQDYEENFPPGLQERILGKNGAPVWGTLSPEMIAGQYDASMQLDLTSGDMAFEKQADQLIFQTMVQDPMVNANPAFSWELRANYLKSLGKKDIEKLIGPKPDYSNTAGDVEDENIMFGQEMSPQVEAQDDHVAHMNGHQQFKREHGKLLTPVALRNLTIHILEHRYAYTDKLKELALTNQQQQGNNQRGLTSPNATTFQGPRVEPNAGVNEAQTPQGINGQSQ